MGRSPCCNKVGLKKGPWTPDEDQKLLAYIEEHGHGSWRALPAKAGLQRCGKSCRLRWTNYLRPDIKRGEFSLQEEQTIIQLHALLGNRWSAIATHLPKRTDNEIKNYWNTHLKKHLAKMGIDPITHKAKRDALCSSAAGNAETAKNAANLSHMAQWESAHLEAEARLVRESKLRSQASTPPSSIVSHKDTPPPHLPCLDVFQAWKSQSRGSWSRRIESAGVLELESPTSTLSFSEIAAPNAAATAVSGEIPASTVDGGIIEWRGYGNLNRSSSDEEGAPSAVGFPAVVEEDPPIPSYFVDGLTDLLLQGSDDDNNEHNNYSCNKSLEEEEEEEQEDDEEAKSYWNNILNLLNSPPSVSPFI